MNWGTNTCSIGVRTVGSAVKLCAVVGWAVMALPPTWTMAGGEAAPVPAVAWVDWHSSTVAGTAEDVTPSKLTPHSKIEMGWLAPAITFRAVFAPVAAENTRFRATYTASNVFSYQLFDRVTACKMMVGLGGSTLAG